jgi:hypothetical protein
MSDDLNEYFAKFQKNFEEVTLTLIGQINKITDNLNRVTDNIQVIEELRIKNSENTQTFTQIEKNVKSLLLKLEKMSQGGFQIPEMPIGEIASAPSINASELDALNIPFTGPASEPDDLEKEFGPLPETDTNESEPEVSTPKQEEKEEEVTEKELPPVQEELPVQEEIVSEDEKIADIMENEEKSEEIEEETPKRPNGWTSEDSLTPLPKPSPNVAKELNLSAEDEDQEGSDNGKTPNPTTPKEYLNNLLIDAQSLNNQKDLGDLILQTKITLSKKIPFNVSYFEMVVMGSKMQIKKDLPIDDALREEAISKIKGWLTKF